MVAPLVKKTMILQVIGKYSKENKKHLNYNYDTLITKPFYGTSSFLYKEIIPCNGGRSYLDKKQIY